MPRPKIENLVCAQPREGGSDYQSDAYLEALSLETPSAEVLGARAAKESLLALRPSSKRGRQLRASRAESRKTKPRGKVRGR